MPSCGGGGGREGEDREGEGWNGEMRRDAHLFGGRDGGEGGGVFTCRGHKTDIGGGTGE